MIHTVAQVARTHRFDIDSFKEFARTHPGTFAEEGSTELLTTTLFVDRLITDYRAHQTKTLADLMAVFPYVQFPKEYTAASRIEVLQQMHDVMEVLAEHEMIGADKAKEMVLRMHALSFASGYTEGHAVGWDAGCQIND